MRSTGSPASSTEENHPAKQLANYKLPNSYAFFDTVHVKTSATMLTVFYMLSLAIADLIVYTAMISSSSFTYVSAINAVILLSISLALYGIWKELSLCMLPLMVIQVVFFCSQWEVLHFVYCTVTVL
ncbi:unnamed protein product [Onchocerca ochengi]|uniref:PGG domain-containing protein n=1 Tax=Onchocerca ochengi TaxID=42157 RepID=A0A182E6N5_ONCOC|nr:unnamed protein product [Onchocerca ochengi]